MWNWLFQFRESLLDSLHMTRLELLFSNYFAVTCYYSGFLIIIRNVM